ncbi:PulJ/GspJ family protein [Euhalothece natronophila]|nr:prepilin-type N-terminal cleavage/methylation domain-containing protein [Euhalothece natronophila]
MKNQPFYRKILCNLSQKTSGFTLIELLVAVIITAVLVTGTGVGLNTILQANARSEQETLRRRQGNRALNYISEDIKRASDIRINNEIETENLEDPPSGSDETWIFQLNIPEGDDITYSIDNSDETLLQDQVIYRREGDEERELLIDLITEADEDDLSGFCAQANTLDASEGFYICLDPGSGRQAEIVIRSELDNGDMIRVRTRAFARSSN